MDTHDYLVEAISCFERCFILIASELWKKLEKDDNSRGEVLIDITYDHLIAERWKIAETLSYFFDE